MGHFGSVGAVPSRKSVIAALAIGAVLTWPYHAVVGHLVDQWWSDGDCSHGFLVVPFAAYVAWTRRAVAARAADGPSLAAFFLILAAAVLFVAGQLGAELFLTRASLVAMLAGSVGFVWGRGRLRVLAFPLAFLLFMIPLPAIVLNQLTLPLQLVASRFGEALIRTTGIPVLREGNVLQLPGASLEVAEACSGIRSLEALVAGAIVLGYFRGACRTVLLAAAAAAVPIAILANALRVAATGVAASWLGPAAAKGAFHEVTGAATFACAVAALYAVLLLMAGPAHRFGAAARLQGTR